MNPLAQKRSFVITLGLLIAVAAFTVDMSLPAVPEMVRALATDLPTGQLIVGVFMLGLACGQIPSGLFSDRVGRMPVFYAGLMIFSTAAVAASLSTSIEIMLVARFVQGIGAASAIVLSRAVVRDIASGQEAAKLMSVMTMIFTAAPVIAPSVGALLVANFGWRAPFSVIAGCGILMIFAVRLFLVETHAGNKGGHPVRQLVSSFSEFFSHRQSIFGLLLLVLLPAGFMSVIAVSAALVVEIYGFTLEQYGLIFACAGISILIGSAANRILLNRLNGVQLITLGVVLIGTTCSQLLLIAWLDAAPFWWLWFCVCLYMFTIPILMSNAMILALDPLPSIAGVASSILGTSQNIAGSVGAITGAIIFNGSVRNSVLIISIAGLSSVLIFVAKPLILRRPLSTDPDVMSRD
jgi:DHA1 family bicyclomycin/chloramphenicol resistance-like MFS transporter